jgi:hypothetical protein
MQRLIRKYADIIYVALTAVDVLAAALLVDSLNRSRYLPSGLIWTIVLCGSIVTHFFVYRAASALSGTAQREAISNLLEIAAKSLVYPESWEVVPIRSFCHRFDRKNRMLRYVTHRASHKFDDPFTDLPIDAVDETTGRRIFVSAEAVVTGATKYRPLPEQRTPEEAARNVWPDIRYVLASPVYRTGAPRTEANCLGVVSFDTSEAGGQKVDLNSQRAGDTIRQVADTVAQLWS